MSNPTPPAGDTRGGLWHSIETLYEELLIERRSTHLLLDDPAPGRDFMLAERQLLLLMSGGRESFRVLTEIATGDEVPFRLIRRAGCGGRDTTDAAVIADGRIVPFSDHSAKDRGFRWDFAYRFAWIRRIGPRLQVFRILNDPRTVATESEIEYY